MTNIKIEDNKVIFPNGKHKEFDLTISKSIKLENNIFVILLKYPLKESYNRNIFSYDIEGNELWQIDDLFQSDDCPYVDVVLFDGDLLAFNWCGFRIKINPSTGEVLEKNYTK